MQADKFDIVVFLIATTILILLLAGLIITLIYFYQKKQLAYQQNMETLKLNHEKTLMETQLEIQENTFQQISREIHDNINLSLTLAKLHLNTLNWDEREKTASQINSSIELISQSITNLSDISKSLNSDIISSQGLITAVNREVQKILETGLFNINVNITGDPIYMDLQKEVISFRIIQESFNNIIKHAKATEVKVTLHYDSPGLNITIQDNGLGFSFLDPALINKAGKAGLKNMETRTKMLDGKMKIESIIDKGTILSFYIPY
ncbi:MAG TPA: ATP-binding protein [Chitinophagaceae bacterium]|nr:ATP-binding protein [Chitinophagaceae bacterium]